MRKSIHVAGASLALLGLSGPLWAADAPPADATAMHHAATAAGAKTLTDEELVASAMKAAPKDVAEKATIVAPDAERRDAYAAPRDQWLHVYARQSRNTGSRSDVLGQECRGLG